MFFLVGAVLYFLSFHYTKISLCIATLREKQQGEVVMSSYCYIRDIPPTFRGVQGALSVKPLQLHPIHFKVSP